MFEPLPAHKAESEVISPNIKKTIAQSNLKSALWVCLCLLLIVLSISFLKGSNSKKTIKMAPKTILKKTTPKKPVYYNYFDSVVFLNDWQNKKVVVSKGTDDYVKQERLVIKTDNHYFNCYCKDLLSTYAVGDTIP